jgi:hypothetical protein
MNEDCLDGMRCPSCGSYEPFYIDVQTTFTMFDDGGSEYQDLHWDDDSYCACSCGKEGTVKDFYIPETPLKELVEGVFRGQENL